MKKYIKEEIFNDQGQIEQAIFNQPFNSEIDFYIENGKIISKLPYGLREKVKNGEDFTVENTFKRVITFKTAE